MSSVEMSGTFALGDLRVRRLGFGAVHLSGLGAFGQPKDRVATDAVRSRVPSTLGGVAQGLGATPVQVTLAWLLRRAPNLLLIPGTSSLTHLRENLSAATVRLPDEAFAMLD